VREHLVGQLADVPAGVGAAVARFGERRDVTATGSCKWTDHKRSRAEDQLLTATEPYIPNAADVQRHYFCSRVGFAADLERLAAADPDRYRLVTPADVY